MISKIIITSDFDGLKTQLESEFGSKNLRFFISDEFLIENAHDVINEAYIAEVSEKMLVIMTKSYRTEAQNALLKIIEEPPRNIKFLIAINSKNMLLPTIRSRLIVENRIQKIEKNQLNLNLKALSLKEIYKFIDECVENERADKFGKNELKALLSCIMTKALESGFKFSQDEFEYFYKLISLADLNTKCHALLTPLLLIILEKGRV
ncbi:DNA polymerase III subunit delta' [Campylobacter sp. faydin G-140]|uniref:DNA polymerase III subunit delta' n=1 Tax=Campylobacter anatolicus TaxID=2829105 RepID=UPI001B92680F|nr:DNA polymerase III subunit delta' [Campylobacter anatolicus]MBR8465874.1 DNA polymerase III subunit delta' [Campylobacter anatolicus]